MMYVADTANVLEQNKWRATGLGHPGTSACRLRPW